MAGACLAEEAAVVGVDRDADRLDRAARRVRSVRRSILDRRVRHHRRRRGWADLFGALTDAPWGVVNNAALADGVGGLPFWEIEQADWHRVLGVNLDGTWLVAKHAARSMIPESVEDGSSTWRPTLRCTAPPASRTTSPRRGRSSLSPGRWPATPAPHGITVNAIAPGLTEGPSAETIPADRHRLYADGRALARPQVPDDVCGLTVFLLSDESAYITGQTIVVDGGFVMA